MKKEKIRVIESVEDLDEVVIEEVDIEEEDDDTYCEDCPHSTGGSIRGYDVVSAGEELKTVLNEIFTDEFMKKHTNFDTFDGFKYSSAVIVNWDADPMIYARALLDGFVNESTEFGTWDEMVHVAADEAYGNK